MDDAICMLPARLLASRLRRGALGAVELLDAYLARIARFDPRLHAVVSLDADGARARAADADAAHRRGESWGPLHGVPMTLKDAHDVAGLRTTVGTPRFDRMATEDGTVAARLRAAGAILMGHTNVPPFLGDYQSANPLFGRTANPWDVARTAGGSSGGAAAALAAGLTPLEIGSDLAGSLRLPAHFCGVYGLKTTEQRVPLTGFFRQPPGVARSVRVMSALGPMARDLDDLRLALSIVAGPDGADADVPPVPLGPRRRRPLQGLRLAVAPTLPGVPAARSVRQVVERVAAAAADRGAQVEHRLPDVDWEAFGTLARELLATITGIMDPRSTLPDAQRTLRWYLDALARRDRFAAAWERYLADVDALLLPPAMTSAFPHGGPDATVDVDGEQVPYMMHGGLLVFANLTGLPALVAPAAVGADALPIGVQLVGPRWSEPRLLEIARTLEDEGILPGFRAPPGY